MPTGCVREAAIAVLFASSSPMKTSLSGSHLSLRPNWMAICPKCPNDAVRCPTSASSKVAPRVFTALRKSRFSCINGKCSSLGPIGESKSDFELAWSRCVPL